MVSGRVVTAAEGSPLKSARVSLVLERSESTKQQVFATTTDSDGRFLLKDFPPGRYRFSATRPGFVNQQYQAKGSDDGALLSLKSGEKVSDVLFRMIVSGVITGRVINEDGEGMVHVQVVALRAPTEDEIEDEGWMNPRKTELRPVASARTDDRGQYRIFGLKPGDYYIRAQDSFEPDNNIETDESYWVQQFVGSEYAPVYYPGVAQSGQAQVVSVKAGDEMQADVLMQRTRTAEIAGHVIGRNGPAKGVWVGLMQPGTDISGIDRQDTTDETGAFRIKGVPPGSYVIAAYTREEGEDAYEPRGQQKIEVSGENFNSLTISLGGGTSLQGRVTVAGAGSPALEQIRINLSGIDGELFGGHGDVKKDGTFEIKSVNDGDYAVMVWGLEKDWYVKSVRLGAQDLLEKGLQLESGSAGGRLEVVVSLASAQLEGSVGGRDGAVIGAQVWIAPEPETPYNRSRSRSEKTDQRGHFALAGLAPGTYRVRARYSAARGSTLRSDPQTVTLSERDHKRLELTIVEPPSE
ncbi:MAG: carboxypeptidase regulatory-like domain-containing protein [Terriglobales bacterium]